jgi:hypothetical protein
VKKPEMARIMDGTLRLSLVGVGCLGAILAEPARTVGNEPESRRRHVVT